MFLNFNAPRNNCLHFLAKGSTPNATLQPGDNLVDIKELEVLWMCPFDGKEFKGHLTCEIGCHLGCLMPGCGGFKSCTKNTKTGKYTCHCKN